MRIDTSIISLVAGAALCSAACGKKDEPAPAPATAQVSRPEADKPVTPETPSQPEAAKVEPEDDRGPANRTQAIQDTLAAMERGDFAEAFKYLDDDVVWTEVGLPDGEMSSIPTIIDYHKRTRTGFSDFRIRAKRVIDSADYQVVELVWSGRHTGAFADGTAATDKTVTLPGAMLVRYDDDGLIDRVWSFQDWPNALQQLGLAPDLPADFKPFELPEATEIVRGPGEPTVRERYERFLQRLGPDDYKTTMADTTAEDFGWIDLASGGGRAMIDGTTANLATRRGSFVRESSTIETAIGAGPFFAAYVTNKYVYKGGFMGVPATDQKVTTHTLDIVRYDPATFRFKTLASYGNSYEILSALQLTAGAARPDSERARFDIEACDDYVDDLRACIDSLDGDKRAAAMKALDEQVGKWQDQRIDGLTRDQLTRSCMDAESAARLAWGSTCPRVDWD